MTEQDIERIAARVAELLRSSVSAPEITKAQLAQALHRTPCTIDRWVAEGMPSRDLGTYRLFDLDACRTWLASRERPERPKRSQPMALPLVPQGLHGVELRTRKAG